MLNIKLMSIAALTTVLAACGGHGDDKLADRVENAADVRATVMEAKADAINARVEDVREVGERRANAIDAADVNAASMTEEQRDKIVANEAPAVK